MYYYTELGALIKTLAAYCMICAHQGVFFSPNLLFSSFNRPICSRLKDLKLYFTKKRKRLEKTWDE